MHPGRILSVVWSKYFDTIVVYQMGEQCVRAGKELE